MNSEDIIMFSPQEKVPKGLFYQENYINQSEHDKLFSILSDNSFQWDNQPQRREVKQYGQIYDYRKQTFENIFEEIPFWLKTLTIKLKQDGIFSEEPNQIIINKYRQTGNRNWSIPPHIDSADLFGPCIASITLGNACTVEFCLAHHATEPEIIHTITVEPKSLYFMTGPSRYDYYHRIPDKKYNKLTHPSNQENMRISLTFRNVIA